MPEPPCGSLAWVHGAAKIQKLAIPVSILVGITAVSGAFVAGNDAVCNYCKLYFHHLSILHIHYLIEHLLDPTDCKCKVNLSIIPVVHSTPWWMRVTQKSFHWMILSDWKPVAGIGLISIGGWLGPSDRKDIWTWLCDLFICLLLHGDSNSHTPTHAPMSIVWFISWWGLSDQWLIYFK